MGNKRGVTDRIMRKHLAKKLSLVIERWAMLADESDIFNGRVGAAAVKEAREQAHTMALFGHRSSAANLRAALKEAQLKVKMLEAM